MMCKQWGGFIMTFWLSLLASSSLAQSEPRIISMMAISPLAKYDDPKEGLVTVPATIDFKLKLYGVDLKSLSAIAFTKTNKTFQSPCVDAARTPPFDVVFTSNVEAYAMIQLPDDPDIELHLCAKPTNGTWIFQGSTPATSLKVYLKTSLLPLWIQIILIILLFSLSGLFSGLNLGLMALSNTELKIVEAAGSPSEKRHAKKIRPVRRRGNFLLCTLLLGNVLVNNSLTILMDDLTGSGLYAVIAATVGIVILGEIIPQAVCSRHGLAIGAYTIWITKLFMVLTFPVSYTLGLILDKVLGEEVGQVFSRAKLSELIREQGKAGAMKTDEINIITGALSLTTKTVADVMTKLQDAYMIPCDAVLDFDTINEIVRHGFTRIPVFEGDKLHIKSVLNVKDLAFIDAADNTPVQTLCDFYNRSILIVKDTTRLDAMLNDFRQGKAHMAFVERLVTEGEGDPYREMIGLVTLEDVIEEIIQAEINDETDMITDNVRRQRRQVLHQDFSIFNVPDSRKYPRLSPQLKVAALRHLTSSIDSFNEELISMQILQSFLNANIVINHTYSNQPNDSDYNVIYEENRSANFAVLLLQGRAIVEVSKEKLIFEAGPFVFFGETVLTQVINAMDADKTADIKSLTHKVAFLPDYTVRAQCNLQYLKITAEHYALARHMSLKHKAAVSQQTPVQRGRNSTSASSLKGSITGLTGTSLDSALPGRAVALQIPAEGSTDESDSRMRSRPSISVNAQEGVQEMYQREWEKHMARNSGEPTVQENGESEALLQASEEDHGDIRIEMADA